MSPTADSTLIDPHQVIADLRRQLARSNADRDEALRREAATAEVLQVINASPGDLGLVFNTILERAHDLCGAVFGSLQLYEDEHFRAVATHGMPEEMAVLVRHPYQMLGPASPGGHFLAGGRLYQTADLAEEVARLPNSRSKGALEICGIHTLLFVPLRRGNELLGLISAGRTEVSPFVETEIALLESFAAQAVIAMENARLISETQEALEQQTATSDVLGVINSSPGDLMPVFDAMLERATALCEAAFGQLWIYDRERFHHVAERGLPPAYADFLRERKPWTPGAGTAAQRVIRGEEFVHIVDLVEDEGSRHGDPVRRAIIEMGGARTQVTVPLRKDNALLGIFMIYRQEVRAFTNKQIGLVQNFAAQAVVAMENARLITETREALEQQTATAEVLQVINSSPGDLAPVFDAILEKAHSLCAVAYGSLQLWDGEKFRAAATHGLPPTLDQRLRQGYSPGPNMPNRALIEGVPFVQIPDMAEIDDPVARQVVQTLGARTHLIVALRNDDRLLGQIVSARREVRPFSDREIQLQQNFAAQAVIAMENARLLTETREALEQQTATAEVLGVINASPGELTPVFDAMLDKAMELCSAAFGALGVWQGERFEFLTARGSPGLDFLAANAISPPGSRAGYARVADNEGYIQFADISASKFYEAGDPMVRAAVDLGGARTTLTVPLTKDDGAVGLLIFHRREIRPFVDREIALVRNFASQAVIAMENARLITETREALERQTATAEVLQVINASPGDLTPVFDAMLARATILCEAASGVLWVAEGEGFRAVASLGLPTAFAAYLQTPLDGGPETGIGRLRRGEQIAHIADLAAAPGYQAGDPLHRAAVDLGGVRSLLAVPLQKEGVLLGAFGITRLEVRPFTDKQIALLENFAAQAVIAMENARLITETREALEQQTATADVLGVINSSPGDLVPVFDAMLEKAMRLCEAAFGVLWMFDDRRLVPTAWSGVPDSFGKFLAETVMEPGPDTAAYRFMRGERSVIQNPDMKDEAAYRSGDPLRRSLVDLGGARSALQVPLVRDDGVLGVITIYRQEVRSFSDKQIALLQNFAAQAVIAMENARLITETREALERQTATSEVLGVINASPGDLAPVFEVMVERAVHLCEADEAAVRTFDGELLHLATTHGTDPTALERLRGLGPTGLTGLYEPFASGDDVVHYVDARDSRAYRTHELGRQRIDARGIRSWLAVALRKEGILLGIINVHRREVRPFSEKQISLLQNFAAQAVIAMENARLLGEIQQRQAELRVTFDNMADAVAMFDQELRLAAWNRNFQELLDLPDALLAGRPGFDDYIRYLTLRGEFGDSDPETEIARLRSRLTEHHSFERTRPDGTVIEVRNNPMPDGGVVVIYSDITERKRSEEEIRAARDAAEAAYRELKAAQANLIQAEKMASLGQLTAGIAHEIKNPLNFVNNFASLSTELLDELKEEVAPALATLDVDKREGIDETMEMLTGNLEKIAEHGKRADNIVRSMLEHSRGVSGERREVDVNRVIEEALNLAYHGARAQDQEFNITLERDYAPALAPIDLASQEMTRVFLNLFGNGFYAAGKRAKGNGDTAYRPTLTVATREAENAIEVRVRDNGTGIPPDIRDKLFQPFFTTKPTGEGTGLGLSISYDIVTQQHGGTIEVTSEEGAFTEFTIRLPRP